MLLKRIILVLSGIFFTSFSFAQIQGELIQSRILILLDRSSSMIQPWAGGKEKYKAADKLILKLMDSVYAVNSEVQFGLRVFGHQSTVEENNCFDSKIEVPFSTDNRVQMALRLEDIHPLGVTAIAYSLKESAEHDLVDESHNIYSIILITDGGESCGGDICEVMKTLINNKVYFKPYILSLEDYAPLKAVYACMGDYLQVIKDEDIPKAVGAIVQAFRPALRATSSDYNKIQAVAANAPSALKVNVPSANRQALEKMTPAEPKSMPIYRRPENDIRLFKLPKVERQQEAPVVPDKIERTPLAGPALVHIAPPEANVLPQVALPVFTIIIPAEERMADVIERLPIDAPKNHGFIFMLKDVVLRQRNTPPMPVFKKDPSIVSKVPETTEKPVEFTTESTDAKEAELEVYFTNGKGKFFTTTPQIVLLDPVTKKVLKKFYRTVDADGNPDPQTNIPAGTYDLSLTARSSLVVHNVVIEPSKKKKVYVTVKNSSISFAYENAPKREVKEFSAVVIERNTPNGRVQNQKCTAIMEYEPGNYHIEINTFPKEVRNVDIDFDETVITLPQPGFAKFTSDGKIRTIQLYQRFGDKFMNFYTLELDNPASKHLQMQPGEYQAHFQKGPNNSHATEQVVQFLIKATQDTEVIIK